MQHIFYLLILLFAAASGIAAPSSFAAETALKTRPAKAADITGVFTLILYGGRHSSDIETIAVFDLEGDRYTFEPYAPEFDYRIKKGLSVKDALHDAETFISRHRSFRSAQLRRIMDRKGKTIGYELRPLYLPLDFGVSDALDVTYWLREGKVKVVIKLLHSVEKQLSDDDDFRRYRR
ncbi:MAG: hypothetical protein FD156_2730 [Nitrospirae bacterium]|nr:MAG: hypothetical protein FD156_2730 [Nitrospirota bacterium]